MALRDDLHKLIDTLPETLVGEIVDFTQFLAQKVQHSKSRTESEITSQWEETTLLDLSERLTKLEADVPAEELEIWHEAFLQGSKPCKYIPGQGLVLE